MNKIKTLMSIYKDNTGTDAIVSERETGSYTNKYVIWLENIINKSYDQYNSLFENKTIEISKK